MELKLLEELCNAFGPSGFEDEVVAVARRYVPESALLGEDTLRNLYIRRPQDSGAKKPVVLLDAHTDEVGFMVRAVKPNGLLQLVPLGGWVNYTIPAHCFLVRNQKGEDILGVAATKPPHYMKEEDRKAPLDILQMDIDIGAADAAEVRERFFIDVGAPVAPDACFSYNEKTGLMLGKAFDCRAGCASVLEVMQRLEAEELGVVPVGALASQEEVGMRGAAVTAATVKPDVAIVFEGCPADDTFTEGWAAQTALKKGPMLRHIDSGMITNPRFLRFVLNAAKDAGIPVQNAVRTGGRTNGSAIHLAGAGVPTVVIGIPVRYAHTHYGLIAQEDYENCVELGLAVLRALDRAVIAGF